MNHYTQNRDYTARDIETWLEGYARHITHAVVAHTHHRPFIASSNTGRFKHVKAAGYLNAKLAETSKSTRYALNCLNRLLYPAHTNRARRNPALFKPFSFVTIEGARETTDRSQTIHVNIALGNLPTTITTPELERMFRHVWHEKAKQKDDVKVLDYTDGNWIGYSLKEAQDDPRKLYSDNSIWDVSNCWIPHRATNED